MKKTLFLISLFLCVGFVISDELTITNFDEKIIVTNEDTLDNAKMDLEEKILLSKEVTAYYSPKETTVIKTEVKTFKGTDAILLTLYYSNGTKATTLTTKQKIELKPEVSIIATK